MESETYWQRFFSLWWGMIKFTAALMAVGAGLAGLFFLGVFINSTLGPVIATAYGVLAVLGLLAAMFASADPNDYDPSDCW